MFEVGASTLGIYTERSTLLIWYLIRYSFRGFWLGFQSFLFTVFCAHIPEIKNTVDSTHLRDARSNFGEWMICNLWTTKACKMNPRNTACSDILLSNLMEALEKPRAWWFRWAVVCVNLRYVSTHIEHVLCQLLQWQRMDWLSESTTFAITPVQYSWLRFVVHSRSFFPTLRTNKRISPCSRTSATTSHSTSCDWNAHERNRAKCCNYFTA